MPMCCFSSTEIQNIIILIIVDLAFLIFIIITFRVELTKTKNSRRQLCLIILELCLKQSTRTK